MADDYENHWKSEGAENYMDRMYGTCSDRPRPPSEKMLAIRHARRAAAKSVPQSEIDARMQLLADVAELMRECERISHADLCALYAGTPEADLLSSLNAWCEAGMIDRDGPDGDWLWVGFQ